MIRAIIFIAGKRTGREYFICYSVRTFDAFRPQELLELNKIWLLDFILQELEPNMLISRGLLYSRHIVLPALPHGFTL